MVLTDGGGAGRLEVGGELPGADERGGYWLLGRVLDAGLMEELLLVTPGA